MAQWHPRDEFSCQAELDQLDEQYERLKQQYLVERNGNRQRAYEISAELQVLRHKMLKLEEREFERLVVRAGEAVVG